MGFGEDLRGELFGKLGVESEADPFKLIEQGRLARQEGNNQGAKKAFESAVEKASSQAEKFTAQSQHRSAAQAYYVQAVAFGELGKNEQQSTAFNEVISRLLEASKTAMAFGENNRGVASGTLAGMVALMNNDQDKAFQIYSDFIEKTKEKENTDYLQKLLYSLGYLLDALRNDNIAAITDAQNYISTDLRPMLATAKLTGFESLLDAVLEHTQENLQGKITMPKIHIGTSLPRDIQFNQLFDMDLKLENSGEGVASDMKLVLAIPKDIEIVDGKKEEHFAALDPSQVIDRKIQMRFLTGDTSGEQIREIKGNVSYVDMLGNSHNQYFGPIEMEFTAISKKDEYQKRFREILQPFTEMTEDDLQEGILPAVLDILSQRVTDLQNSIQEQIDNLAFDTVDYGLAQLEKAIEQVQNLTSENELTTKFSTQISEVVKQELDSQKEELEAAFEEEKTTAIEELTRQKTEEMEARVEQLKADLKEQHNKEVNELKDSHQSELQQIQQNHETRRNQALVQHENKLKEEFKSEKEQMRESYEKQIQELKSTHQEELTNARKELRDEITAKYEEKISNLEKSREEMKNEMNSRHQEELAEKDSEISKLRDDN